MQYPTWDGRCTERVALSGTYEAGIEAAGQRWIGGSLNHCAAISEDGYCVLPAGEAQKKLIGADLSVRPEALLECGEVYWTLMFVNLHRVAAAEGDMGPAFTA